MISIHSEKCLSLADRPTDEIGELKFQGSFFTMFYYQ